MTRSMRSRPEPLSLSLLSRTRNGKEASARRGAPTSTQQHAATRASHDTHAQWPHTSSSFVRASSASCAAPTISGKPARRAGHLLVRMHQQPLLSSSSSPPPALLLAPGLPPRSFRLIAHGGRRARARALLRAAGAARPGVHARTCDCSMASAAFEPARAAAQLPAMCAEAAALMKPDAGALEAVRTVFCDAHSPLSLRATCHRSRRATLTRVAAASTWRRWRRWRTAGWRGWMS